MTTRRLSERIRWAIAALMASLYAAFTAQAATSVSQYGITWTFDKDYQVGQFANGDYWVVGPVRITQIQPASTVTNGRTINGSMLNPAAGVGVSQGFDSSMTANVFSPTLNVARPNGSDLSASNPLILSAGSSLISSISHPTAANRPQLTDAAVLTVLPTAPAPSAFRPPYCGTDKTIIATAADINFARLANLPRPQSTPSLTTVTGYFQRPWIEIQTQYGGREMHPSNNQPDYGRDLSKRLSLGLLSLQLNYTNEEKRLLAIRLVQYGIDVFGAAKAGGLWAENGGHNQGRKMPMLLAGVLLNRPEILEYADASKHFIFQEDRQTFYVTQAEVDLTNSTAWKADPRGGTIEPYTVADIGTPEWGIMHTRQAAYDNRAWSALYRDISSSATLGHVLTARIMKLDQAWNWPAIFDYYSRYARIERNSPIGTNTPSLFEWELWDKYWTSATTTAPSNAVIGISVTN